MAAEAIVRMIYSCWTYEDVLLAAELEQLAAGWPNQGFSYKLVLTRELADGSERGQRQPKRPRIATAVCGRRVDETIVQEHLMSLPESRGGTDARPDVLMTIVSGPSG